MRYVKRNASCSSRRSRSACDRFVRGARRRYGFLPDFDWDAHDDYYDPIHYTYPANAPLAHAYLPNNDLSEAFLGGSTFTGANLSGSSLRAARVIGSDMSGADLTNVNLSYADLQANLLGADLGGANMTYLRAWNIAGCPAVLPADWSCRGTFLIGPKAWVRSNLDGMDLSGAVLSNALLDYSSFDGADLSGATLTSASMVAGTNLTDVYWYSNICPDHTFQNANACCEYMIDVPAVCTPCGYTCWRSID